MKRLMALAGAALMVGLSVPGLRAEDHVVPLSELQKETQAAGEGREANLSTIGRVLNLPQAQEALKRSNVNADQATRAVATLNDQELARLAERARTAEQEVEGGIIVGILALIGLIVVIIVVVAIVA